MPFMPLMAVCLLCWVLLTGCGLAVSRATPTLDLPRVTPAVREPDGPQSKEQSRVSGIEFQFETELVDQKRCREFYELILGADNTALRQFLEPGLGIIAADLGGSPTPDITFTRGNFDVPGIQSVLRATSIDRTKFVRGSARPDAVITQSFGGELATEESRLRAAGASAEGVHSQAL